MADLAEIDPTLALGECMSPQGCGMGTENACFALTSGETGMNCMYLTRDENLSMTGILLSWRMNIDPVDGLPWCPRGVIATSKKLDEYPDLTD